MADSFWLLPILVVGLIGILLAGGYGYHWLKSLWAYLARRKTTKLHLEHNRREIETAVMAQKIRDGYTSERVRVLLRWLEYETPEFRGGDAGLLLGAQEATLRELDHANGSG